MYKILLERHAEKDLDTLDNSTRKRVIERILLLKENPRPPNSKKLKGLENAWRIRIGNYRDKNLPYQRTRTCVLNINPLIWANSVLGFS